jgi:glucose/arabinose dehydrogenase
MIAGLLGSVFLLLAFATHPKPSDPSPPGLRTQVGCAPDNASLSVPPGFCVQVFADGVGRARHIVVGMNGDVFVALRSSRDRDQPTGILALRDVDGDGQADMQRRFGDSGGTGIALRNDYLYFAPNDAVLRYPMRIGRLEPLGPPDTLVSGLPAERSHRDKSIAIARDGGLYVNIGAPSNACQAESRTRGSPGQDPCPELETRGGIWRFDANRIGQTQADGERFATGLRNVVALTLHPLSGRLFGAVHGRDQLNTLWPDLFDAQQNAEKPSEELVLIESGDDFGWPYCYHDPEINLRVLAPEYGGDGLERGRCTEKKEPMVAFPAHWAPNGLLFYSGTQFPSRYRLGAFVAFHGSWNRAPLPQGGYNVVFVPFAGDRPAGDWEVFADGFAGAETSPGGAVHRPVGLAQGPDGSLFVTDDRGGRIYKISYVGG